MFWCFIICSFTLYWVIKYYLNKSQNAHIQRLPGLNVHPIIQNLYLITVLMANDTNVVMFRNLYRVCRMFCSYGIFRMYIGMHPFVFCFSSDSVQAVLNSNRNLEKKFGYNFLSPWLKEGLLTSNGLKWKMRRKLLTPSFHFQILEEFRPILNKNAKILVEIFRDFDDNIFDAVPYMSKCALDVLCETALGIRLNSMRNKDCSYLHGILRIGEIFPYRILRPWFWSDRIFYRTKKGKEVKKIMTMLNSFAMEIIHKRKTEINENYNIREDEFFSNKRLPLLDLLLYHQKKGGKISDDDILQEVNAFMFAGHDTTAYALSWVLYLLGLHSDIQKSVLKEIDAIFGNDIDRDVTMEDIKELKYLDCVIKESLRLFPSVPLIARDLTEDVSVNGYIIPKGTTCILYTYLLHRNPYIYLNPNAFNPNRFTPENCKERRPFSYIPFSAGSRNCIGQRLALMEEKIILSHFFRNYTVETVEKDFKKLFLTGELILRPKFGIKIKLKERNRKN